MQETCIKIADNFLMILLPQIDAREIEYYKNFLLMVAAVMDLRVSKWQKRFFRRQQ